MDAAITSGIFALAGVTLGIGLTWGQEIFRDRRKNKREMLSLYSAWIKSVKESFHSYFLNENFYIDSFDDEYQILLFEKRNSVLRQMEKIKSLFYDKRSDDFNEVQMMTNYHGPNWILPQLHEELEKLIEMVK